MKIRISPDFYYSALEQQNHSTNVSLFPKSWSPTARFCMFHFTNGFVVSLRKIYQLDCKQSKSLLKVKTKKGNGATWITFFVEYKCNESSQQSKINESSNLSLVSVLTEEWCSLFCELIPVEVVVCSDSFLAVKFWSDSSSCFPSVKPGTEGLPSVEKNKNKIPELICESQIQRNKTLIYFYFKIILAYNIHRNCNWSLFWMPWMGADHATGSTINHIKSCILGKEKHDLLCRVDWHIWIWMLWAFHKATSIYTFNPIHWNDWRARAGYRFCREQNC